MSWLSKGLRAMGVLPDNGPTQIDTSGIPQHPAAGRTMSGDIGSETFSATGGAPQGPPDMIPLGDNNALQYSSTSSDPSQMFQGGDQMFRNFGRQQPGFNVFGPQAPQGGAPQPSFGQPGQSVLNVNGGGFGDAIRGLGGIAGGAISGGWDFISDPENAQGLGLLAQAGGAVASGIGAYNEGQIMDDERRRRDEEDRRRREAREQMSPMLGQAIRNARGR